MTTESTVVQIPGDPVAPEAKDLAVPTTKLLKSLGLLESTTEQVTLTGGTPPSLQVIKAGALSVTKAWTALGGLAGLIGAGTTIGGAVSHVAEPTRVAIVAGGSAILVAALFAIAIITRGDVRGRADVSCELYDARSRVAVAFLAATRGAASPDGAKPTGLTQAFLAALSAAPEVRAKTSRYEGLVSGLRTGADGVEFELPGDWVPLDELTEFEATFQ